MGDRVVEVGRWDGEGADDSGVSIVRYVRGAERVGDAQVGEVEFGGDGGEAAAEREWVGEDLGEEGCEEEGTEPCNM